MISVSKRVAVAVISDKSASHEAKILIWREWNSKDECSRVDLYIPSPEPTSGYNAIWGKRNFDESTVFDESEFIFF